MSVYLLHFDPPYRHAKHYLGWAPDDGLTDRIAEHRAGYGAKLTAAAVRAGCALVLARVWPGYTREDERHMKGPRDYAAGNPHHKGGHARRCPICAESRAIARQQERERVRYAHATGTDQATDHETDAAELQPYGPVWGAGAPGGRAVGQRPALWPLQVLRNDGKISTRRKTSQTSAACGTEGVASVYVVRPRDVRAPASTITSE